MSNAIFIKQLQDTLDNKAKATEQEIAYIKAQIRAYKLLEKARELALDEKFDASEVNDMIKEADVIFNVINRVLYAPPSYLGATSMAVNHAGQAGTLVPYNRY